MGGPDADHQGWFGSSDWQESASQAPNYLWMVEHVSSLINKYYVASHGKTAYEFVHGKRSKGRTVEFGKNFLYHVPKKLRSKFDLRWRTGIFLGTAPSSNEIYVATDSGSVIRSRSMCRVVHEHRWSADLILGVAGTPMKPNPNSDGPADDVWLEETAYPHELADLDVELVARPAGADQELRKKAASRIRITKNDLLRYGFTHDCPKCNDVQANNNFTGRRHTEECRWRLYSESESNNDPKWRTVGRELGLVDQYQHPKPAEVDDRAAEELIGNQEHVVVPETPH